MDSWTHWCKTQEVSLEGDCVNCGMQSRHCTRCTNLISRHKNLTDGRWFKAKHCHLCLRIMSMSKEDKLVIYNNQILCRPWKLQGIFKRGLTLSNEA